MSEDMSEACSMLPLIKRDWLEQMARVIEVDFIVDAQAKADLSARIERERMELRALGVEE